MTIEDLFTRAVRVARAGEREEARSLFLEIIAQDDGHEMAWLWLSGLVDELEDQIVALENALSVNPKNTKARRRLEKLQSQRQPVGAFTAPAASHAPILEAPLSPSAKKRPLRPPPTDSMRKAMKAFKAGDFGAARSHANYAIQYERPDVNMWLICARTAESLEEEISALEHILDMDPGREKTQKRLVELEEIKADPFKMVGYHLEKQQQDKAMVILSRIAKHSPSASQRQEALQQLRALRLGERNHPYQLSSPNTTFFRMLFGPLLLYIVAIIVQAPTGIGLLVAASFSILVLFGSSLTILMKDALNHALVYKLFGENGVSNEWLRRGLLSGGMLCMALPFIVLFAS